MAKYCSKCGRALPEGVEICPDCHVGERSSGEAAPFTLLSAETEIWKDGSEKTPKVRKRLKPGTRERILLYTGAVLLLVLAGMVIWYTQPGPRVRRAIRAGSYDSALTVYSEKIAGRGKTGTENAIGEALVNKAAELCDAYEAVEIDGAVVKSAFDSLYAFGLRTEDLEAQYARFDALYGVHADLGSAEKLIRSGQFIEACEILLSIPEDDPEYEAAQSRAQDCYRMYSEKVLSEVSEVIDREDYPTAIETLRQANEALIGYGSFSADIDARLEECYVLYSSYALLQAEKLEELGEYESAWRLLKSCADILGYEPEALTAGLEKYAALSNGQTAEEAIARSEALYDEKDYTNAFLELETAASRVVDPSKLQRTLEQLEKRYYSDVLYAVRATLDGNRDNIDAALEQVRQAAEIRALPDFDELAATLEGLRPVDLVELAYTTKEGEIFRSAAKFDSRHESGWIWGEDGASVTFTLGGEYDLFEAVLCVRTEDDSYNGWFEVYLDGELTYTSGTLSGGGDDQPYSWKINGCQELRLQFHSDYTVSTKEDGTCFHGLTAPVVMKDMI